MNNVRALLLLLSLSLLPALSSAQCCWGHYEFTECAPCCPAQPACEDAAPIPKKTLPCCEERLTESYSGTPVSDNTGVIFRPFVFDGKMHAMKGDGQVIRYEIDSTTGKAKWFLVSPAVVDGDVNR